MTGTYLKRLLDLVTIIQSGRMRTIQDIADFCRVSRRTILRDLRRLDEAGVRLAYDRSQRTYRVPQGNFMGPANLSPDEAVGLLLLVRVAANEGGVPFGKTALRAAAKVVNSLPHNLRTLCLAALRHASPAENPARVRVCREEIFWLLEESIRLRRVVKMSYRNDSQQESTSLCLMPYKLILGCLVSYVLGKSILDRCARLFRLDHIDHVSKLGRGFPKEDFDADHYIGKAWSLVGDGELHTIVLRFSPRAASSVIDTRWHKTQHVHVESDGSAIVEFCVDGLNEITWWILGYGDQVQVLAPDALRSRIAQIAKGIVRRHGS